MTFTWIGSQALNLVPRLRRPKPARLVATRRDDLVALGVKRDFTDFVLVALQDGSARTSEDIVDSRHTIGACCR